jgi:hypothetical protein
VSTQERNRSAGSANLEVATMVQLEGSPDRLVANFKKNSENEAGKKLHDLQKVSKLAEVDD